jgi:hypothetical protein
MVSYDKRIRFDDTPNKYMDADKAAYDIPITINLYETLGCKVKETTTFD